LPTFPFSIGPDKLLGAYEISFLADETKTFSNAEATIVVAPNCYATTANVVNENEMLLLLFIG